ncbi:hypothetical protein [Azospirillum sp. ST 5-10]|uniref:hypothetical protein n=1 Tax=unclassified Azospirillum TaxID=2630922 RepID=UPI003F4A31C2
MRVRGMGRRAPAALAAVVSAVVSAAALSAGLLAAGCSDRTLDTGLVGGLTGARRDLPETPVRPMTGEEKAYPNLATVPERPTDIPTVAERQRDLRSLESDRAAAKAAAEALERELGPVTVPPRPDLTPGRPAGG